SFTPFSSPLPAPISTVNMKMPQKTPNAVNAVRSLCCRSVLKISCHFSMSSSTAGLLRPHRFDRRDLRSAHGGCETGKNADRDQQHDRGDRNSEVDLGIHKVRHLRACAAQSESDQFEQSHAEHEAHIARNG